MGNRLFDRSLSDLYASHCATYQREIDQIPEDVFLQEDPERLSSEFESKFRLECPVLSPEDQISMDAPNFTEGSLSTRVRFYIPFSGDHTLFGYHGSTIPVIDREIDVKPNLLSIVIHVERTQLAYAQNSLHQVIRQINDGLTSLRQKANGCNGAWKSGILHHIDARKGKIAQKKALNEQVKTAFGFPLRKRDDGSDRLIIPVKPKTIDIAPRASLVGAKPQSKPEPELLLADYDQILEVIRSMVAVFERSPSVFKTMEEEHLRTILLVALNGLFKGNATGETFNGAGKTDILIRVNNENIFITECLIWSGADHFRKKLTDQLFRYSTWHDSKLAAVVFNRNKDFTSVVQKMKEVVAGLSNRISEMPYPATTGCRARLRREDDPQKHFVLTCLAFEVPT